MQRKQPQSKLENGVRDGKALEAMIKTEGWKVLERWIESQREGSHIHIEREVSNSKAMSLIGVFNSYIKYMYIVQENRAYSKIKAFVDVTIANGRKYESELQKQQTKQSENK